jgi:hypothetical protein
MGGYGEHGSNVNQEQVKKYNPYCSANLYTRPYAVILWAMGYRLLNYPLAVVYPVIGDTVIFWGHIRLGFV